MASVSKHVRPEIQWCKRTYPNISVGKTCLGEGFRQAEIAQFDDVVLIQEDCDGAETKREREHLNLTHHYLVSNLCAISGLSFLCRPRQVHLEHRSCHFFRDHLGGDNAGGLIRAA